MDEIFTRTSVRSFSEQMPTDGQIEQILKAAMQAPSAANQRPWEFYVVKNRELLSLLSGVSSYGDYVKDAPLAIVICFKESELKFPAYVPFDCACAAMNIWLCAEGLTPCGSVSRPSHTAWGAWAKFQICPLVRSPFASCRSALRAVNLHQKF